MRSRKEGGERKEEKREEKNEKRRDEGRQKGGREGEEAGKMHRKCSEGSVIRKQEQLSVSSVEY